MRRRGDARGGAAHPCWKNRVVAAACRSGDPERLLRSDLDDHRADLIEPNHRIEKVHAGQLGEMRSLGSHLDDLAVEILPGDQLDPDPLADLMLQRLL